jgi:succinate-semialdehyde dehydrogenase / glutarate-semialdehyde dehydrogenase
MSFFSGETPFCRLLRLIANLFLWYQVVGSAAANLMAGNVVLTKHASNVQRCAEALEQLFWDAGCNQASPWRL